MGEILHTEIHRVSPVKPWIVFIHGAGGSIKTWKRQEVYFRHYFNVLLIDLRDHGLSKNIKPSYDNYSFRVISEDVKTVLDKHQVTKANFITLSFGSVLIQDFASRYPEYIDKVVFAGAVLSGGFAIRAFAYCAKFLNLFLTFPVMYRLFSYILMPKKENQFARRLYQSQAKRISQKEYMKWLGLYREFFKLLKAFRSQTLSFPSLIVMGENDFMFLPSAKRFSNYQENTVLMEVPEAGHIVNIEKSLVFNERVHRFLNT